MCQDVWEKMNIQIVYANLVLAPLVLLRWYRLEVMKCSQALVQISLFKPKMIQPNEINILFDPNVWALNRPFLLIYLTHLP